MSITANGCRTSSVIDKHVNSEFLFTAADIQLFAIVILHETINFMLDRKIKCQAMRLGAHVTLGKTNG